MLTEVSGKLTDAVKFKGERLMIYAFGTYKLDATNRELYDDGHLCKLDLRTIEVLIYLVEHRNHFVSREELVEKVWSGGNISDGTIHNCIATARKAIGDSGDGQLKIRTAYGQGYRFVAEAREQNPVKPMFKESEPHDGHTVLSTLSSSVDPASNSQNVLIGDHGFVSVLCGTLECPEALVSSLGFEATQSLRHTFFALAKGQAQRHEGMFKFFGADGFLIFFGLPVAHEDHVRRAVKAGLRIQEHLYESCSVLDPQSRVDATVQMGLHTGLIEIRSEHNPIGFMTLTKSETTVLAIQLHYLAKGGELLTSKATLPHVEDMVTYVEHGAIPRPRHAQPAVAYRICGLAM